MLNFISQSHNQITASHMSTDELLLCYHSDDMKSISLPRYKLLSLCPEGEMSDAPPQHKRAHLTRAISITYRAPGEGCKTRSLVGFHKSIFPLLASCLYLPCAAEETKSFPRWHCARWQWITTNEWGAKRISSHDSAVPKADFSFR